MSCTTSTTAHKEDTRSRDKGKPAFEENDFEFGRGSTELIFFSFYGYKLSAG